MMTFRSIGIGSAIAVLLVGCARNPAAPDPVGIGTSTSIDQLAARPPAQIWHAVAFAAVAQPQDPVDPGHIDAAAQSLLGSISGAQNAGTLRTQVSGSPYTWVIQRVSHLPGATGTACTEDDKQFLAERGLVGAPHSGALSLTADQRTSSGERIDYRMTGITDPQGGKWEIWGNSTIDYPARISGDARGVTVVMESAKIAFKLNPKGVKAERTIGCTVDFTVTIVPQ